MRKFSCILTAALMIGITTANAQYVDGGTTGRCRWEITGSIPNYTLTISGTGALSNYVPWYSYRDDITSIEIGNAVTAIGIANFFGCTELTSVTIGNSVISIGDGAFLGCSRLTSITIPNSVTSIGESAFTGCSGLTSIYVNRSTPPTLGGSNVFNNVNTSTHTLYVPAGATDYATTAPWSAFTIVGISFYTLTFDAHGGTPIDVQSNIPSGTKAIQPADPTRTGYEFDDWYKEATCDNAWDFETDVVTSNVTLFAKWTVVTYNITYNLNGGTNHATNPTIYTIESVLITLQAPTKDYYDFAGWSNGGTITAGSTGDTTFTASWTPTNYNITYELNGGINNAANPPAYTIESALITLQAPTKNGYNFVAWSNGGVIAVGSTGDATFTASWTPTNYNITYELNGGINNAANPPAYTIESALITLQAPTKNGYNFVAWSNGGMITAGSTGGKTFTASWTPTNYNITYALNGGTNNAANPPSYTIEDALITLQAPTKDYYNFVAWSNGGVIAAGSTGDTTFTASWTPTHYNITYELNGGTNNATNPALYTIESTLITLQAPTRDGYDFAGWSNGGMIAAGSTGDTTFTASWTATNYNITYELNGGTNHAANPALYTIKSTLITLQAPTRDGYTFAGWSNGGMIAAGSTGDTTFTASWTATNYNITYELNGGTNNVNNPATYTIESIVTLQAPTKDYYNFVAWSNGGVIAVGSTGDATFTASWASTNYNITYELNGGTNHATNPALYTIESTLITLQAPTRDGYDFAGWSNGGMIAAGSTGDTTFTASWMIVTPIISAHPQSSTTVNIGDSVTLSVSSSMSGVALTYQWYRNTVNSNIGGTAVGTNSNTYTPSTATAGTFYYYVVVTNPSGATASVTSNVATVTVSDPAFVVTRQSIVPLKIYPNPVVNGELRIESEDLRIENGEFRVEIYNVNGAKVLETPLSIVNYQLSINIAHLPSGEYIVKIGNRIAKVVKR